MSAFHAAFEAAFDGEMDGLWPHLSPDERTLGALAVYRNTALKGRIDALQSNFPCIVDMVGPEWFRAAAREFVEARRDDDAVLLGYGAGFAEWLAGFAPARDMPYLGPCARLDRAWTEAHLAPDAPAMSPRDAAALGLRLTGAAPGLHPSARLSWFDWTAASLWLAHRYPEKAPGDLVWRPAGEGLLIHRPEAEVHAERLSRAEWLFLNACRKGAPFGVAAMAAADGRSGFDIPGLFARLVSLGVFAAAQPLKVAP
jgi:hypothetical protein